MELKVVVHRHCYSARKKCEIPVKLEPVSNEEPSGFRSNNTLPIETTDPSISLRIADDSGINKIYLNCILKYNNSFKYQCFK